MQWVQTHQLQHEIFTLNEKQPTPDVHFAHD